MVLKIGNLARKKASFEALEQFCRNLGKTARVWKRMFRHLVKYPDAFRKHLCVLSVLKHVPCFYRVIETRVKVWENEKCCGNTSRRRVFPQLFRVLPNFHECFYKSIETRSTCFLFLLENNATKKRKTAC